MRKVILTASDFEMFDTDISNSEFEFFQKHRDAFRRMWQEQGREFWISFIMTFRKFAVEYGVIKEFPSHNEQFQAFVDDAFILIHEHFVDVKVNQARSFLLDVVIVAQNKHTFQYLESKSYAKDPFYAKDTRDVFRRLFGAPTEKASYIKVYVLHPVYLKFAGSVCVCLRRWLDAEEVPDGEQYDPIVTEYDPLLGEAAARLQQKALDAYHAELADGNAAFPVHVPGWPQGRNPRVYDAKNPLYNPLAGRTDRWSDNVKAEEYLMFYGYCVSNYASGKRKMAQEVDKLKEEEALRDIDAIAEQHQLPKDVVAQLTRESLMNLNRAALEQREDAAEAYEKELQKGVPRFPLFVPEWPLFKDPRFYDDKNPLYRPRADKNVDWRKEIDVKDYQRFYTYVVKEYGRKKNAGQELADGASGDGKKVGDKSVESLEREAGGLEAASGTGEGKKKKKKNKKKKKAEAVGGEKLMEPDLLEEAEKLGLISRVLTGAGAEQGAGDAGKGKVTSQGPKKEKVAEKTEQEYKEEYVKQGKLEGKTYVNYKKVHVGREHVCPSCNGCRHKHVFVHHREVKTPGIPQEVAPGQKVIQVTGPKGAIHVCVNKGGAVDASKVTGAGDAGKVTGGGDADKVTGVGTGVPKTEGVKTRSPHSLEAGAPSAEVKQEGAEKKKEKGGKQNKTRKMKLKDDDEEENDPKREYVKRERNGHRRPPASVWKTSQKDPFLIGKDAAMMRDAHFNPQDPIGIRDEWMFDERLSINFPGFDSSRYYYLKQMRLVDPCSRLENEAHVVYDDDDVWSLTMMRVPLEEDENDDCVDAMARNRGVPYQKLQLLESNNPENRRYWVFSARGKVGGRLMEPVRISCGTRPEAEAQFKKMFQRSTGNEWEERKDFKCYRGCYSPVDLHECVPKSPWPVTSLETKPTPPRQPRLIEEKDGAVLLTSRGERADGRGQVCVTVEKRIVSGKGSVLQRVETTRVHTTLPPAAGDSAEGGAAASGQVSLREKLDALQPTPPTLQGYDAERDASDVTDEDGQIKVIRRERQAGEEEVVGKVHIGGPFSPQEKKALQYLESLEDLRTMIEYTNEVKSMKENMDQVMRDACAPRPKPKKKKAAEVKSEDPCPAHGDVSTARGDAEKVLSEKGEKWAREADVIKQCADTIHDNPRTRDPDDDLAIQRLKEIFGLTHDFRDLSAPGDGDDGGGNDAADDSCKLGSGPDGSADVPEGCPSAPSDRSEAAAAGTKADPKPTTAEKKGGGKSGTDSCLKISLNLTDDTKVELLQEDSPQGDIPQGDNPQADIQQGDNQEVTIKPSKAYLFSAPADSTRPASTFAAFKLDKSALSGLGGGPGATLHVDMRQAATRGAVKIGIGVPAGGDKSKESKQESKPVDSTKQRPVDSMKRKQDSTKPKAAQVTEPEREGSAKSSGQGPTGRGKALRVCSGCTTMEPAPKTYKKCQKCKEENVKSARYYCGRECQVADWTARHKKEHRDHMLQ